MLVLLATAVSGLIPWVQSRAVTARGPLARSPAAAVASATYEELKQLDSMVDRLQSNVIEMLMGFYDSSRSSFAITTKRHLVGARG